MERKPYKNSVENEKYIILALAEIMKTKSFNDVSVTEVCKKAGVSKNTFYRHFNNLSDVIYQSINEINDCLLAEVYSIKTRDLNNLIFHVCHVWYENRELFKAFTQEETTYIIYGFCKKNIVAFFSEHKINETDNGLFFDFFATVFCMFLKWWCVRNFEESPEEVAKHIEDCLSGNALERFKSFI